MLIALVEDRQGHRLAGRVEEAKIALSEAPQTGFRFVTRDVKLETPIALEELQAALEGAAAAIASAIERTLAAAGVKGSRIDTLILTGGSTRVPAVGNMLRGLFPEAKAVETDAFGSVGSASRSMRPDGSAPPEGTLSPRGERVAQLGARAT